MTNFFVSENKVHKLSSFAEVVLTVGPASETPSSGVGRGDGFVSPTRY
jgi:hypothetical protein